MDVVRLKSLLNELPNDFSVTCNTLGNLIIIDGIGQYHGYIDFTDHTIHVVEELEL